MDEFDELRSKVLAQNIDQTERDNNSIYAEAKQEWMDILSSLWKILSKPVDPIQFSVYVKVLSDIPLGLLEETVNRVINGRVYSNIPTPGEIRKEVDAILYETQTYSINEWTEASWSKVMRHSIEFANSVKE